MTGTLTNPDVADGVAGANNALLLAPSFAGCEESTCTDLLHPEPADEQNVLLISYTKSTDAQLRRWRDDADGRPANLGIVTAEDSTRSIAAACGVDAPGPAQNGPVETVSNPDDLTGLGIRITEFLTGWDDDRRTVVCFDSLTSLLQYVDLETAYEFLHVVTGRMAAVDAVAHYHMDPGAHDDRTVESVVSLMDAVVTVTDDGHDVRSRNV